MVDVHILALPGNTGSLVNAFGRLDCRCITAKDAETIAECERLVIPGQGRFDNAIKWIDESGWRDALLARLRADKPTLGICLGMQILFEGSDEGPGEGLGFFSGRITRLDEKFGPVPNIGWLPTQTRPIGKPRAYYYAHSYASFDVAPLYVDQIAGRKNGETFVAAIAQSKVYACQFHPEKSQKDGEAYLRGWLGIPA